MDLFTQLSAVGSAPRAKKPSKQPANYYEARKAAWEAHTQSSITAYKRVMQGAGWLTQRQIEFSLGYAATSSTIFLKRLREDFKLVERRNRDDAPTYNRMRGYEWRWKDEQK